ncbi:MAG: response regulator [Acidobacteriota bacterium]
MSGRVLIIDDEPLLAEGFKQYLEIEGLEVFIHTSLITLPFAMKKINPDVILLDLMMPALSGTAVFEAGAHRVLRSDAPIILFSGRGAGELAQMAEELGADGFLPKSIDMEDAVRRIGTWIMHRRAIKNGENLNVATRSASALSH